MSAIHVHLLETLEAADGADISSLLTDGIELTHGQDVPPETEILVGGRPTREQLASPRLTTLIIPWVGVPTTTRDLLGEFPNLQVHNLHHNAPMVAELAIALLLAAAKFVVPLDRALRRNDWTPRFEPSRSVLLTGKTALILGYGAIGRRVARLCRAFGMTVVVTRAHPSEGDEVADEIHPSGALRDLLPRADALIVCLPLTAETSGLLGAEELALLPNGALLVNVGRGRIVDEKALYEALRERRLAGAGLDVWYRYPEDESAAADTPPASHPFCDLDNVVLSPHRGGSVAETELLRMRALAETLRLAAAGQSLPNSVDLERGY
jgi:phosphoglycerate dehydrogenase-like enzyme